MWREYMNENKSILNISKKSFFSVLIILFVLMISAYVLTYLIPQGQFQVDADGNIIAGTFTYTSAVKLPIYKIVTAPFETLFGTDGLNVIVISIFLLILGGFFTIMQNTHGIEVIIKKLVEKYKDKKYVLIRLISLIFMMLGAFFGIFESSLALMPIIILLSLSLGFDTMLGLGLTLLSAGFGFASAITNPFSVGIASEIAGINILNGVLFRIGVFIIMYLLVSTFLVRYAKKIEKDKTLSLTYEDDLKKTSDFKMDLNLKADEENKIFKVYVTVFIILLAAVVLASLMQLIFSVNIPSIPIIAATFLFGGFISGTIILKNFKKILSMFLKGTLTILPAVLLILMAASVKFIIDEGEITGTILNYLVNILSDKSAIIGILGIYLMVLMIQFFIGSASAKAFLIMPILVPLVSLIGITKELSILAFIFGDGYTNVIFPTNGVLLIGLSIAAVSYNKWFKWTIKLQLLVFALTCVLLMIALFIGY